MRLFWIFIILTCVCSCKRELEFDYHDIPPIIVIEGELTPECPRIGLTLTTPMDEPMDRRRLTDARVTLENVTTMQSESLSPDENSYFTGGMHGMVGDKYRLTVERDGKRYETVTTMYGPTEILSVDFNWISMPYDKVAVFQARFRDNPDMKGECYWVKLYRNGEIYLWAEVDDRKAENGVISFTRMTSRQDTDEEEDDEVLYDGDEVTCTVTPISKEMHDYLEALQNDSNGPAMFSGDMCLGYFIATSSVSASIIFRPHEIPEYKP